MNEIEAAFLIARPELVARYDTYARAMFDHMVKRFGPAFKGVRDSQYFGHVFRETVSRCTVQAKGSKPWLMDGVYSISDERLAVQAAQYADEVIAACRKKLLAKIVTLDGAKVHSLGGINFDISGTRKGHDIFISQQMIHNVSRKGLVFAQFPARIRMDGKAISEAAYKRTFA